MRSILCVCLVAVSAVSFVKSAPATKGAEILEYTNEVNPDGSYDFSYELSDGSKRYEHGEQLPGEEGGVSVRGYFAYIGPDGVEYRVEYESDDGGFRAKGAHIPEGTGGQSAAPAPAGLPAHTRIASAALASLVG